MAAISSEIVSLPTAMASKAAWDTLQVRGIFKKEASNSALVAGKTDSCDSATGVARVSAPVTAKARFIVKKAVVESFVFIVFSSLLFIATLGAAIAPRGKRSFRNAKLRAAAVCEINVPIIVSIGMRGGKPMRSTYCRMLLSKVKFDGLIILVYLLVMKTIWLLTLLAFSALNGATSMAEANAPGHCAIEASASAASSVLTDSDEVQTPLYQDCQDCQGCNDERCPCVFCIICGTQALPVYVNESSFIREFSLHSYAIVELELHQVTLSHDKEPPIS